jgi:hypothetical protein
LERDRQLRRLGRWTATGCALAALAFGTYYQVMRMVRSSEAVAEAGRASAAAAAAPPSEASVERSPAVDVRTAEERQPPPAPVAERREPPLRAPPIRRAPVEVDPGPVSTREVIVRITGAMGGTLKVDGQPMEWFGDVSHALTVGPHHFEFLAPDSTCCQSTSRTVMVVPGDGAQEVIGDIPFVDATLRVGAEDSQAGLLTCPTLFSGDHRFPPERKVTMSSARATGTCTLRPEVAGSPLQKTEVTLRPGQTTVIPWP